MPSQPGIVDLDHNAVLQALLALSNHTCGRPLTPEELRLASKGILGGMLLAAAESIVDQGRKEGSGKSRGYQALMGYMNYLEVRDLGDFFTARIDRLAADMKSYKSMRRGSTR
ncbi:hypothetical protein AB0J28_09900 [Streptosporangium canum]|uniref:hypothetical protein n=1 Tax=Streptosporangium canum TaxID=324952 RepID=UPI003442A892